MNNRYSLIASRDNMKALLLLPLAACISAQAILPLTTTWPYGGALSYGTAMPYAAAVPTGAVMPNAGFMPYKTIRMADIYPSSQFHAQADMGQFSFGHSSLDQSRSEVRLWNGQVLGHYSYIDSNGEPAITYYEAGPNGYRVLGSNRLPEGPAASEAAEAAVPEYTKEVAEARADFAKTFEEVSADGPEPSYIDYTKEVADARADFAKVHEEASAVVSESA